jgi:hypothetical protein
MEVLVTFMGTFEWDGSRATLQGSEWPGALGPLLEEPGKKED